MNKARQAITVAAWVFRTANQTGWRSVMSRQEGTGGAEHFTLTFNNNNYRWLVKTQTYSAQLEGLPAEALLAHLAVSKYCDGGTCQTTRCSPSCCT
jgi:hypothetical protein